MIYEYYLLLHGKRGANGVDSLGLIRCESLVNQTVFRGMWLASTFSVEHARSPDSDFGIFDLMLSKF